MGNLMKINIAASIWMVVASNSMKN